MAKPIVHPLLGELDPETSEPVSSIEREAIVEAEDDLLPGAEDDLRAVPKSRAASHALPKSRAASHEALPKSYCESCGGVDQHMPGCPALRGPHEFVDFTQREPGPIRQAIGWALRALGKKIGGP